MHGGKDGEVHEYCKGLPLGLAVAPDLFDNALSAVRFRTKFVHTCLVPSRKLPEVFIFISVRLHILLPFLHRSGVPIHTGRLLDFSPFSDTVKWQSVHMTDPSQITASIWKHYLCGLKQRSEAGLHRED